MSRNGPLRLTQSGPLRWAASGAVALIVAGALVACGGGAATPEAQPADQAAPPDRSEVSTPARSQDSAGDLTLTGISLDVHAAPG